MYGLFCSFPGDGAENPGWPSGQKGWSGSYSALHFPSLSGFECLALDAVNDYGFSFSPRHAGCWHWHVSSVTRLASAQVSLQYFFPFAGTQLQAGRAHFDAALMSSPFVKARHEGKH
jgi:hypothetical protein